MGSEKLGNLSKREKEAHEILCKRDKQTLLNPSSNMIQEEAEAYERWMHIAGLEEDFLKQRAKLYWLDVGDPNNKTFHCCIKTRQAQNTIRGIRNSNGVIVATQKEIKMEAERFFSDFLNQSP